MYLYFYQKNAFYSCDRRRTCQNAYFSFFRTNAFQYKKKMNNDEMKSKKNKNRTESTAIIFN